MHIVRKVIFSCILYIKMLLGRQSNYLDVRNRRNSKSVRCRSSTFIWNYSTWKKLLCLYFWNCSQNESCNAVPIVCEYKVYILLPKKELVNSIIVLNKNFQDVKLLWSIRLKIIQYIRQLLLYSVKLWDIIKFHCKIDNKRKIKVIMRLIIRLQFGNSFFW